MASIKSWVVLAEIRSSRVQAMNILIIGSCKHLVCWTLKACSQRWLYSRCSRSDLSASTTSRPESRWFRESMCHIDPRCSEPQPLGSVYSVAQPRGENQQKWALEFCIEFLIKSWVDQELEKVAKCNFLRIYRHGLSQRNGFLNLEAWITIATL